MKRGAWHQCGDKSQKLVQEQLQNGFGAGVIISPRDLALQKAMTYAAAYRSLGASVVLDPQFHVPDYSNSKLDSYGLDAFRTSVSQLHRISDHELSKLAVQLNVHAIGLQCTGVIAPAVVYEAARDDILGLNARLFKAAKSVGDALSVPTYATVFLGRSIGSSDRTLAPVLSQVTALNADGWYYSFEFDDERVPSGRDDVERYLSAGLTLACTGKPVLHAYVGPMGILSFGVGATAVGIGHSQNLWKFTRQRWESPTGQGGGGNAPARFFSSTLWGTIIYPDETVRLPSSLRTAVLTHSGFSHPVEANLSWERWDANKHLVSVICSSLSQIATQSDPVQCAGQARTILQNAVSLHGQIARLGIALGDSTNSYQQNWENALECVVTGRKSDFDYLTLLNA